MDNESLIIQKTAAYQVAQMQLKGDPDNIQLQDAAKAAEAELKALTKGDGVDEAKAKADADAKAKADADAKADTDEDGETQNPDNQAPKAKKK